MLLESWRAEAMIGMGNREGLLGCQAKFWPMWWLQGCLPHDNLLSCTFGLYVFLFVLFFFFFKHKLRSLLPEFKPQLCRLLVVSFGVSFKTPWASVSSSVKWGWCYRLSWRLNKLVYSKPLEQCLAHEKHYKSVCNYYYCILIRCFPTPVPHASVIPSQGKRKGEPDMALLMAVLSDKIITA